MAASKQTLSGVDPERAKILEGVDFIETEEDTEAVESAVVKIQSTFRGKKIRSKLGQKKEEQKSEPAKQVAVNEELQQTTKEASKTTSKDTQNIQQQQQQQEELSEKVNTMQVNDNSGEQAKPNAPEEEAERAAAKIQAGFKGYKTRKELEAKLQSSSSATTTADQQEGKAND